MIAHIVNREHDWQILHHRIITIDGSQQDWQQRGLPIMAMENICWPDMLRDFDRRAAEFAVAFGIVGKIASGISVKTVAIEVSGITDKKVAHAIQQRAIHNRRKPQTVAHRHGKARNYFRTARSSPVPGQHHGHFVTARNQRFGQRFHYIGKPSGLRKRQTFRGDKEDSHNFGRNSCTL